MSILQLTEEELWFAEQKHDGFLVALWLDLPTAEKLALPSGEVAGSLHITLAYCGDAAEMGELGQARAISAVDGVVRYRDRLQGTVSGYGRFISSESSGGKDVFYVTPDIPQLAELRQSLVNCLLDCGVQVSTAHGYTPHITLAYLDPGSENPVAEVDPIPLSFTGVTIMSGDRRIDVPFWDPALNPLPVSMSETGELPLEAPLGSAPARALYFGSFDKEWIPFLPKPGNYVHESYGNMDLSSDAYTQMLTNFNNYVYKQDLPIRATHTPQDSGAVGWIKPGGMRIAGDGSIEVKPEWNTLGKGLVEDDRFRYVSAEFCKTWTDPVTLEKFNNVAVGLALVTRPHFKTDVLNPLSEAEALAFAELSASPPEGDTEVVNAEGGEADSPSATNESGVAGEGIKMSDSTSIVPPVAAATPSVPEVPVAPVAAAVPEAAPLPSISLSDLTQVVITAEQRQKERQQFSDLTARMELAERRAVTAETKLKEVENERRKEKFTAEVLGRSAESGVAWFGPIQENVAHLVSLAETYGDDSPEVKWAVNQKRNEAKAIKATNIFDPISLGNTEDLASVTSQVARLAEQKRNADPTLSMEAATTLVYNENPDLYLRSL